MKKQSFTGPALALKSGVKPSFIYDVLSGKSTNPSSIKLAKVAEALGVSLSYLVGEHSAFAETAAVLKPPTKSSRQPVVVPATHLRIPFLEVHTKSAGNNTVRKTAQGNFHFHPKWVRTKLHTKPEELRLFTIDDDAMSPSLYRGDTVLVDLAKKRPSPPGIFVLFDGFSLVARRLKMITRKRVAGVYILCDNPRYTAVERPLDKIRILGRVVWMSRQL